MSKGNIVKISQGTFKEVAKESHTAVARNINTSAAGKINETAKGEIRYGEPIKREGSKDEYIDVVIGIFFDGTSNNRTNIEQRIEETPEYFEKTDWLSKRDGSNASYENDPTNVDKLEKYYPKLEMSYFSIYIEGIGTEDKKGDYTFGQINGMGSTGVEAKVYSACRKAADNLYKIVKRKGVKINKITIDVFGFSRGAAAARYCVHELTRPADHVRVIHSVNDGFMYLSPNDGEIIKIYDSVDKPYSKDVNNLSTTRTPPRGHFGQYMALNGVKYLDFEIRLAGLFDSVSAHGPYHGNDVKDLKQNAISAAKYIIHLTAADEHREKFELTHVIGGLELSLPGVHSDVGGGYRDYMVTTDKKENKKIEERVSLAEEALKLMEREELIKKERDRLIEQGWYKADQLSTPQSYKLVGTRILRSVYSLVPLHIMKDFCELKSDVKFSEDLYTEQKIPTNDPPPEPDDPMYETRDPLLDMAKVYDRLKYYAFKNNNSPMIYYTRKELANFRALAEKGKFSVKEYATRAKDHNMLMQLRNRYLHWSASWDGVGMEPRIDKEGNRKREVFNLPKNK